MNAIITTNDEKNYFMRLYHQQHTKSMLL